MATIDQATQAAIDQERCTGATWLAIAKVCSDGGATAHETAKVIEGYLRHTGGDRELPGEVFQRLRELRRMNGREDEVYAFLRDIAFTALSRADALENGTNTKE